MRRSAILAVVLLFATATTAQAGMNTRVSGTYSYELLGGTSTVTLDATADGLGSGTFTFARSDGVLQEGVITCVFMKGHDAQVFGVASHVVNTEATFWGARAHDSGLDDGVGDMAISFAGPGEPPAKCNIPLKWGLKGQFMVPIASGDTLIH